MAGQASGRFGVIGNVDVGVGGGGPLGLGHSSLDGKPKPHEPSFWTAALFLGAVAFILFVSYGARGMR